ncbi:enoyl-CoA hydratase-related protein [Pseudoduganella sp. LjRoot289]|uniref:enoyl-CoA hydratase/isomerase family protein n=1 Tax=Pseudoduganella sp. LjRoot289 TaxID=3342314 RepID=UPI003ED0D4A6
MAGNIESALEQGVMHLTFSSEDGLNTMDDAWVSRLDALLRDAQETAAVRVVLLSGQGSAFCAGADMRGMATSVLHQGFAGSPLERLTERLAAFPKPLLAAVHGMAIGGGATMLLHCDLVVAASDTQFRLPFTALGATAEFASSWLLPRAAGTRLASELMLLARFFDAEKAMRAGLVNELAAPGEELALARSWARELAALAPASVRLTKRLLREGQHASLADTISHEGKAFVATLSGPEVREAVSAFKGKRRPDFSAFD